MSEPLDAEARDERTLRPSLPSASSRPPDRRHWLRSLHWLNGLVAKLVVAGIIGAALALVRSHVSPASSADFWVGGPPVTREVQAGGLDLVMQVTPGPYFLGELLAANLSLRNDSRTTYTLAGPAPLAGPAVAGVCGTAVFVTMSGGNGPQYVPPLVRGPGCHGDFTEMGQNAPRLEPGDAWPLSPCAQGCQIVDDSHGLST